MLSFNSIMGDAMDVYNMSPWLYIDIREEITTEITTETT